MADKLFLELVSPEKKLLSCEVDNLFAHGKGGAFGLYPDHSPFFTEIVPCVLSYAIDGNTFKYAISTGFLEVVDNKINLLVNRAISSNDVKEPDCRKAYEELQSELSSIDDEKLKASKENDLKFYEAALSII